MAIKDVKIFSTRTEKNLAVCIPIDMTKDLGLKDGEIIGFNWSQAEPEKIIIVRGETKKKLYDELAEYADKLFSKSTENIVESEKKQIEGG
jgi:antitoxin component of MazEF toxin-antitoxin module